MNARPIIAAAFVTLACAASGAHARKLPAVDTGASNAATLGVPSFVWGRDLPALPKAAGADPQAAARAFLASAASKYKMTPTQVDTLVAGDIQRFADGGSITRFANKVDGIEVFRDQVNVLIDKSGTLVAVSGFTSGASSA